jgi:hypothetical protein
MKAKGDIQVQARLHHPLPNSTVVELLVFRRANQGDSLPGGIVISIECASKIVGALNRVIITARAQGLLNDKVVRRSKPGKKAAAAKPAETQPDDQLQRERTKLTNLLHNRACALRNPGRQ